MYKWVCQLNQLDESAGRTSWTDQLDVTAGPTSSFYLKPWPVCIFEDFPFSLYIVAASESDEGLVWITNEKFDYFGSILSKVSLSEKRYLQLRSIYPNIFNTLKVSPMFIIQTRCNWEELHNYSWFLILTSFHLDFIFLIKPFMIYIFYIKQIVIMGSVRNLSQKGWW